MGPGTAGDTDGARPRRMLTVSLARRIAKQVCVGKPTKDLLSFLFAHRFYQIPARACVWIDVAVCASFFAKTGNHFSRVMLRDKRGASMVEFALVMLPFFILLFGIIEVGLVFWGGLELENATDDAARMVRTGQAQAANFEEARMKQEICGRVSILADCTAKLKLDMQSFTTFAQMTPPAPLDGDGKLKDEFTFSLGGPQQVVLMTSFYEWPLLSLMSSMGLSNMASGNRLLRASAAFRNEPFPES